MVEQRHLGNAPITEAIIDFRVRLPSDTGINTLKEITENLPEEYSEIEPRNQIQTEIMFGMESDPKVSSAELGLAGYWCKSDNGLNIAQIRMDGFTFSELRPYSNWEEFSGKARHIWEVYREKTGCDIVSRVAVRYINHLELPLVKDEEFSEYIVAQPEIPKSLPQIVSNFLYRVSIVMPTPGVSAHVSQVLAPPENPDRYKIILDIDVFKESVESMEMDQIWDTFLELRNYKNDIFFEYITEKTLELIK